MNESRINKLAGFLKEDPSDPFLKYALAQEYFYEKPEKAKKLFKELLKEHVDYLATYYKAAEFFIEVGESKQAEIIYQKGIELATMQNDQHTLAELKNAYINWEMENL